MAAHIGIVALTALITTVLILVTLNLSLGERRIGSRLQPLYSCSDPQFRRAMSAVMTPALVPGNTITALINGERIFPAMLGSIAAASGTVTLETFIYWSGSVGNEFCDAFARAAKRGVQVKLLLDWVGGDLDRAHLEKMRSAGVDIRYYNTPAWFNLDRVNNRTHRKLMVVDGRTGFIGGVGFADTWRGDAQDPSHWRDTHFEARGPVVAQLQSAFIDNWLQASGEVLHGDAYLPPLGTAGSALAQVFTSAPRGGSKSMQLLYLMSITAAVESIDLSASYFLPSAVAIDSLVAAARRGVRIRIIVPGQYIDKKLVRYASRACWGKMLAAGIEIFEYQPTMFHCKVLVVDRLWVSVGSTNFDSRSFSINDESNMNVYDREFAARQGEVFEEDLRRSRRVTYEEWTSRDLRRRALDKAAALLRLQL